MINVLIVEDSQTNHLLPLTATRPSFLLMMGFGRLADRISHYLSCSPMFYCRAGFEPVVQQAYPQAFVNKVQLGTPTLIVNGRLLIDSTVASQLLKLDPLQNTLVTSNGQMVALMLHGPLLQQAQPLLDRVASSADWIQSFRTQCVAFELEATLWTHLTDYVTHNLPLIQKDFVQYAMGGIIKGTVATQVAIDNEDQVTLGLESVIEPFVSIHTQSGPVYIGDHVTIQAGSRLEGPLVIGNNSHILGGKVSKSTIGPWCKVAGEVSNSVFYGYDNKAHEGFVGHSYIGEWVNLGALTTTSNLKNTYGNIKLEIGDAVTPTAHQFLGSIIGDHVKMGIGTLLNAGTVIGTGACIWGGDIHPKTVPNFAFGTAAQYARFEWSKFVEVTQLVMQRRKCNLPSEITALLRRLWETGF